LPKIAPSKGRFLAPSHGLEFISISQKIYKVLSPSTIVLIGNIQSIRNKRKMAKPEKLSRLERSGLQYFETPLRRMADPFLCQK
jgi:hypothetical protein